MKPGPVVPTPEGVFNGAPAVERKGADTPPPTGIVQRHCRPDGSSHLASECPERPAILDWAPNERLPLPNESPSEHVRNGLQLLYELEVLLQSSGDFTSERRAVVAAVKRRLGWALRGLAPHAL